MHLQLLKPDKFNPAHKFNQPYLALINHCNSYIDGEHKPCLMDVIDYHLHSVKLPKQIITIKFFAQCGAIAGALQISLG